MKKKLYVWYDADNNQLEVFKTLKKAKDYGDEMWPDQDLEWEGGNGHWSRDYEHIYEREIRE